MQPFQVGDHIHIENKALSNFDCDGTVESVGLRSTVIRLRRFGQLLVIPNDELVSGRIVNESRLLTRRAEVKLHLRLDTPVKYLESIPNIIKDIVEQHTKCTFGYCGLLTIDSQALCMECTFTYNGNDIDKYKRTLHAVNIAILAGE